MALLDDIRSKIAAGAFEFSKHAVDQTLQRKVSVAEVREVLSLGEIIEDYPNDKYGPSCLVYGRTSAGRPLHVQCSYPSRPILKVITLYEPSPDRWLDFRERKS
jgi:hypothetical protein